MSQISAAGHPQRGGQLGHRIEGQKQMLAAAAGRQGLCMAVIGLPVCRSTPFDLVRRGLTLRPWYAPVAGLDSPVRKMSAAHPHTCLTDERAGHSSQPA